MEMTLRIENTDVGQLAIFLTCSAVISKGRGRSPGGRVRGLASFKGKTDLLKTIPGEPVL